MNQTTTIMMENRLKMEKMMRENPNLSINDLSRSGINDTVISRYYMMFLKRIRG